MFTINYIMDTLHFDIKINGQFGGYGSLNGP